MAGLSYGVVRVDTDDKLTSLTLQDVGVVMPGGKKSSIHFDVQIYAISIYFNQF